MCLFIEPQQEEEPQNCKAERGQNRKSLQLHLQVHGPTQELCEDGLSGKCTWFEDEADHQAKEEENRKQEDYSQHINIGRSGCQILRSSKEAGELCSSSEEAEQFEKVRTIIRTLF